MIIIIEASILIDPNEQVKINNGTPYYLSPEACKVNIFNKLNFSLKD